jgi:hypothetical protein
MAAGVLTLLLALGATSAAAAGAPPLPKPGPGGDPLLPSALESQNPGNFVLKPTPRDQIAKKARVKYCKPGPYNFWYFNGPRGKAFSASLIVPRFCHQGNRVSEVSVTPDHELYGIYNFFMKFDHQAIQRGYYNWRNHGNYSGYLIRAMFYFTFCYEPSKHACTKNYRLYLRTYIHEDGTSSTFQSSI